MTSIGSAGAGEGHRTGSRASTPLRPGGAALWLAGLLLRALKIAPGSHPGRGENRAACAVRVQTQPHLRPRSLGAYCDDIQSNPVRAIEAVSPSAARTLVSRRGLTSKVAERAYEPTPPLLAHSHSPRPGPRRSPTNAASGPQPCLPPGCNVRPRVRARDGS